MMISQILHHQQKKPKLQPKGNLSPSDATSNNAATIVENLDAANIVYNQQPTNIATAEHQKQLKNGIFDFILPSEEDSVQFPVENLDPSSAGLRNPRSGGVWNRSLEEAHSAQVKERSLLGHLICSEETQKKILESDIFRILKSRGWGGHRNRRSVQSFSFKVCFGLRIKSGEGET